MHRDAGLAGKGVHAHDRQIGIGRSKFEPEIEARRGDAGAFMGFSSGSAGGGWNIGGIAHLR